MLETSAYLLSASLAFFSLLLRESKKINLFFGFAFIIPFSLIIRTNGYDADMQVYSSLASTFSLSFYMLREVVFWWTQHQFWIIFQDPLIFFFTVDLLIGYMIIKVFNLYNFSYSAFFSFYLFFPVVSGMQNTFRQFIASIFCLFVLHHLSKTKASNFLLLISPLIHNAAAIFYPFIYFKKNNVINRIIIFLCMIFGILTIGFFSTSKSQAVTGEDYAFVLSFLTFILVIWVIALKSFKSISNWSMLALSSFAVITSFLISSAASERVTMFLLVLIYPSMINSLSKFRQKRSFISVWLLLNFTILVLSPYINYIY